MPVAVHCPNCSKELLAPDELVGKLAACPQCNTQFSVPSQSRSAQPAAAAPDKPSDQTPMAPPAASITESWQPQAVEPPAGSVPDRPAPSQATKPLGLRGTGEPPGSAAAAPATSQSRVPGAYRSPPEAQSNYVQPPAAEPTPPKTTSLPTRRPVRTAETAKFVSAEAADTRVQLGQDGQLPSLVLDEETQSDSADEEAAGSSPWLLVVALCFSFAASAALVLIDTQGVTSEPRSKASARLQLESQYTRLSSDAITLEPYQQLLRRALQAHNKEDYASELQLYRRVLNLLHAENNSENQGLTGQVKAEKPPNDEHLEDLLSTLISD